MHDSIPSLHTHHLRSACLLLPKLLLCLCGCLLLLTASCHRNLELHLPSCLELLLGETHLEQTVLVLGLNSLQVRIL